jgi:hypothetical protein
MPLDDVKARRFLDLTPPPATPWRSVQHTA